MKEKENVERINVVFDQKDPLSELLQDETYVEKIKRVRKTLEEDKPAFVKNLEEFLGRSLSEVTTDPEVVLTLTNFITREVEAISTKFTSLEAKNKLIRKLVNEKLDEKSNDTFDEIDEAMIPTAASEEDKKYSTMIKKYEEIIHDKDDYIAKLSWAFNKYSRNMLELKSLTRDFKTEKIDDVEFIYRIMELAKEAK